MTALMRLSAFPRDPAAHFLTRLRRPIQARRPVAPSLVRGGLAGFLAAWGAIVGSMAVNDNLHEVVPGRVFRGAQMSPNHLRRVVEQHHVRTVVNLRGTCPESWYLEESRVTHDAGISQEDVCLSAIRLPTASELRRLLDVFDGAEYPILLHCRYGVDRTGLAAVVYKLLQPGVSFRAALRQLSVGYGYVPYNGTENMALFFDLYEEWLTGLGLTHSPELFRHWARHEYCPGASRGTLTALDFPAHHLLPARKARTFHVRASNSSVRDWQLTPALLQGVHLRYRVFASDGSTVFTERAGLFDAIVKPANSIDLSIGIPPLTPGEYVLHIDLIDASQNTFGQFGGDPLIWPFRVGP